MFDGIPFGSASRIMSDRYGERKRIGQLGLDFGFPGMAAATVTAARVSQDEQLTGAGITLGTFLTPPVSDGMSSKGGSVVGNADYKSAAILMDIVNSVRNSDADGIGAEIVVIDATRLAFPATAGISEVAHQFAFFGINAD